MARPVQRQLRRRWRDDVPTVPTSWHIAGTGDFNGDGRDESCGASNGRSPNGSARTMAASRSTDANTLARSPTAGRSPRTGDFNGDGRDESCGARTNGAVTDWLGQANGGFVDKAPRQAGLDSQWHLQPADIF